MTKRILLAAFVLACPWSLNSTLEWAKGGQPLGEAPSLAAATSPQSGSATLEVKHLNCGKGAHRASLSFDSTMLHYNPEGAKCSVGAMTIPTDNLVEAQFYVNPLSINNVNLLTIYNLYKKGQIYRLPATGSECIKGQNPGLVCFELHLKVLKATGSKDTVNFHFSDPGSTPFGDSPTASRDNFRLVKEVADALVIGIQRNMLAKARALQIEQERIAAERSARPSDLHTTVQFDDSNSIMRTGQLEAGEKADLVVNVSNRGEGPAYDVSLVVSADNDQVHLPASISVGEIEPGQQREMRVPIEAGLGVPAGELSVDVEARERRGYNARKERIVIPMARFERPALSIESVLINDGSAGLARGNGNHVIESGETIELIVLVKNSGNGPAALRLSLSTADQAIDLVRQETSLGLVRPGEVAQGRLAIALPRTYSGRNLALRMKATDGRGENIAAAMRDFTFPVSPESPRLELHPRFVSDGKELDAVTNGQVVDLEVTPANSGSLDALDIGIRVSAPDAGLAPSEVTVGVLKAGETGAPQRFSIAIPRNFVKPALPIKIEMTQKDFPSTTLAYDAPLKPRVPLLKCRVGVDGRLGNTDLDQNQENSIDIQVSNTGALGANDVRVRFLSLPNGMEVIGAAPLELDPIPPSGQAVGHFKVRVLRSTAPGPLVLPLEITQADFPPVVDPVHLTIRAEQPEVSKIERRVERPAVADDLNGPIIVFANVNDGMTVEGKALDLTGAVVDPRGVSRLEISINGIALPDEAVRPALTRSGTSGPREPDRLYFKVPVTLQLGPNQVQVTALNNANLSSTTTVKVVRLEDALSKKNEDPSLTPASDVDRYILAAEPAAPDPHRWAVVIGIQNYRNVQAVDYARRDAYWMRECSIKILGVPESQTFLLTDDQATQAEIRLLLEGTLRHRVQAGDTVFVYFAGHGVPKLPKGEPYLIPADGDPESPEITCYNLEDFYKALGSLPARHVVVFLDSCFSGGRVLPPTRHMFVVADPVLRYPTVIRLAAANGEQVSNPLKTENHGLFTYYLLKGLGPGIRPSGSKLWLSDLAVYIETQVSQLSRKLFPDNLRQDPSLRPETDESNNIVLRGR